MKAIAAILSLLLALVAPVVAQEKLFTKAEALRRSGQSLIVSNTKTVDGYRQVIRVAEAPHHSATKKAVATDDLGSGAGRPERLECVSTATVTPLANELTYGAGGPHVPTRLFYEVSNQAPQLLYDGSEPLSVPIVPPTEITLQPGEEIRFIAESAYPDFVDPNPLVHYSVGSDHPVVAAILTHESNFFTVAQQKGFSSLPFGMQESLENILGPMVDWNTGQMNLLPTEMIILFELGASGSGADFNDLALYVRTECEASSEVVLRDSIGTNPQDPNGTDGNFGFTHYQAGTGTGAYTFATAYVTPSEAVRLTEVSGVFSPQGANPVNLANWDFEVRIWTSHSAVLNHPSNGNFVPDIWFAAPTSNTPWGISVNFGLPAPAWKLSFDVSAAGVILSPGQTYVITVVPRRLLASEGALGIVESRELGDSDIMYTSNFSGGFRLVEELFGTQYDGRVGLKVVGVAN